MRPPSPTCHFDASLAHAASCSSDEMSDVASEGGSAPGFANLASSASASVPLDAELLNPDSTADLSALGCLSPPAEPESHRFLLQLARVWQDFAAQAQRFGAPSTTPVIICPAACVGTPFWLAFAELNSLFARHFSTLPTSMLRGYHSFTRAPRAQLWARFAASQGAPPGTEATFCLAGGRPHAVMTRFLLEHVLAAATSSSSGAGPSSCSSGVQALSGPVTAGQVPAPAPVQGGYPTASLVTYTLEVPDWLRCWCARWGQPPAAPLRVLALFAFEADGARSPRVLYVPVVSE
ncbi:hypothetical protein HYH02_002696 [Chlamydomonas schloesseri]|uniref:Uncharacterized protein n=1 Tax=Chlamydomonas schloesseri TaxID=2026947 RepID=A0A836BAY2_9CHLO|nr:hypothetical protein HYH02_002696 [Chlamydomonas schloesseri]|eukprot:KAG2452454.1 hypothetical protein HYH02_002696 [Chlamydomonas schloesseri]